MLTHQQDENANPVAESLRISDEEYHQWQQSISQVSLPDNVFELIYQLRQHLETLPDAPYISDRRWKKAIHLLQASAFYSGRSAIAPIDLILLKDCLWHDIASMQVLERAIDLLMTQQAWQQQTLLLRLQQLKARRLALQQQQSVAQAITLEKHSGMFSRKQTARLTLPGAVSHSELPAEISEALDELDTQLRAQRHQFSQHQRCLFISDDWLARIETSLQDVADQLKQARK